jgi:hypothetical protein
MLLIVRHSETRSFNINAAVPFYIHSFIFHSVNPYKVINNLKDIELVILLVLYRYRISI